MFNDADADRFIVPRHLASSGGVFGNVGTSHDMS